MCEYTLPDMLMIAVRQLTDIFMNGDGHRNDGWVNPGIIINRESLCTVDEIGQRTTLMLQTVNGC